LLDATVPPEHRGIARDEVKLLVTNGAGATHEHARFSDLPLFLRRGDLLVVNDSRTVPAALMARREDGEIVRLHVATMIDTRIWTVEPRSTVRCGEELRLPDGGSAVCIAPVEPEHPRLWYAWFQLPVPMYAYLARHGQPIRYRYIREEFPLEAYQTIFAREAGSAEMPSAARPFTARVLEALGTRGVEITAVTLHCGVASFELPERPSIERYRVGPQAADAVNRARAQRRRVFAVGSTVLRALETAADASGAVVPAGGWTDLVIDASHEIRTVDGILTGFHDAAATHQSILRAFLPEKTLGDAYAEAAAGGYYQHEFGDVHLIQMA
jgi:S-adenosylmethionine:tRNA ribosyltransferase-isomerase